eukprot:CAMPEP_0174386896 /NCGR_PEP_ID=MMETSP0811_2-20130205/127593_1 /TAXON_ID=73025 ORGANISM="Eutreptiella gymnastica-like, Strain CCMP1594" /NCGR_SAMPLE_ID=MMETSP0811_2 /ASSEMBLY_ACC=CAM_ASM_000667 /LENGTH=96 /DNA_ID=CAMNT_0015541743 /DNA_START=487 /DNA_END=778 /DNA_ORIENTATION=+
MIILRYTGCSEKVLHKSCSLGMSETLAAISLSLNKCQVHTGHVGSIAATLFIGIPANETPYTTSGTPYTTSGIDAHRVLQTHPFAPKRLQISFCCA